MRIHQLSVTYLAEQDRILARINTDASQEMRLWLTRRLMLGLWPLLNKLVTTHLLKLEPAGSTLETADDDLKQMLTEFRKEEFLKQADFDTPYQDNQQQLPLGEDPLLVTDVDVSPLPTGRLRMSFNERLVVGVEPRSFTMEMEPQLMQGLMHLLELALARSQWREAFGTPVAVEETVAADDESARKPRYLN
ncbi:hypothetical protein GHT07_01495 [Caenimonas koreensis DSM 17982]|uniref:Uncharacterized protein n=1 Tax=Caenimonas koreensis DSM 17982 TaxID=1121255 RepID=A0A844B313_9BURK|nr:hypothetical protein [Caenimonas koreensis]MRD45937.1 hypothetical protein [Caenimonas koreensis DSM 17982]